MKKDAGKKIIAERVEEFERNKAVLTKKGHGETNIRSNYIDILFHALGWDMKSHYEVVREFSQRDKSTESGTKKVDYAFKINGKLKFFIEAKEASIDLEKDKGSIYQAKRYAYSSNGKAPIVILTDFEELRVFNVIKAPLMDNTDRELLKSHSMKYTEYLDKWDLLWDTFSKEAVQNGSLDKLRGKIDKNTKTMDVDFLEQITCWRESLAKNIANRNQDLNIDEINEAVQRILDRLVFIRNLEDREIEPENTLLDKTKKSENIYKSIIPVFNALDKTYNGLLFKKHFSENIDIDDKTIKDIIRNMSYPVSPFQFDVIEPEILGRIYEKFLGSKIRLTPNHQAKIEEKIEVRKAGGVYYTPEYIVEYIVKNTVGKKIEGLTPEEIKKIRIVDPACGSGSFLIGAYTYILEYHQKWYSTNQKEKLYQADWYKTKDGEIKVNLEKRGDILRNNIYGVDIDKEATEVAIMSLYLKMLDDGFDKGERDLFFVKGSILPDMIENIKCGNSLISTDYFEERLDFDISEMKEIKPFNWEKEFPSVYKNGGFDCAIGNPPYIDSRVNDDKSKKYWKSHYVSTNYGKTNTYEIFIERCIQIVGSNNTVGLILPTVLLNVEACKALREYLINNNSITNISYGDFAVFEDANVDTIVIFIKKIKSNDDIHIIKFSENFNSILSEHYLSIDSIDRNSDYKISLKDDPISIRLQENIQQFIKVSDIAEFYNGIATGPDKDKYFSLQKLNDKYKPLLMGNNIGRYSIHYDGKFINYDRKKLHRPREEKIFLTDEKIIMQRIRNLKLERRLVCTLDVEKYYTFNSVNNLLLKEDSKYNIRYLLALLNSNLLNYLLKQYSLNTNITLSDLELLPIKQIDFNNSKEIKYHNDIIQLVNQMLESIRLLTNSKSESEKNILSQKISLIDENLNRIIYELYGLTADEIKLIES